MVTVAYWESAWLWPRRTGFESRCAPTEWFVTQMDQSTGLLHRELGVRVSPGQQYGRIAPMVEHRFEAPAVQVRVLFRPQQKEVNDFVTITIIE